MLGLCASEGVLHTEIRQGKSACTCIVERLARRSFDLPVERRWCMVCSSLARKSVDSHCSSLFRLLQIRHQGPVDS